MQVERIQEPGEKTVQQTSIGPRHGESEELLKLDHGTVTEDTKRLQACATDCKSTRDVKDLSSLNDRRSVKRILSKAYRRRFQQQAHEPESMLASDRELIPKPTNESAHENGRSPSRRLSKRKSFGDTKVDHRVRRRSSSRGTDGSPPSSPRRARPTRRRSKASRDYHGAEDLNASQRRRRQRSTSRDKTHLRRQRSVSQEKHTKEPLSTISTPQSNRPSLRRIRSVQDRPSKPQKSLLGGSQRSRRSIGAGARIERNKIRSKAAIQEDPSVSSQTNASSKSSKTSRVGRRHRSLSNDASRLRSRGRSQDTDKHRKMATGTRKASSQSPSRANVNNQNGSRRRRSATSTLKAFSERKPSRRIVKASRSVDSDDRSVNSAPTGQACDSNHNLAQELTSLQLENSDEGNYQSMARVKSDILEIEDDKRFNKAVKLPTSAEGLLTHLMVSPRIDRQPKMRRRRLKGETPVLSSRKQVKEQTSSEDTHTKTKLSSLESQQPSLLDPNMVVAKTSSLEALLAGGKSGQKMQTSSSSLQEPSICTSPTTSQLRQANFDTYPGVDSSNAKITEEINARVENSDLYTSNDKHPGHQKVGESRLTESEVSPCKDDSLLDDGDVEDFGGELPNNLSVKKLENSTLGCSWAEFSSNQIDITGTDEVDKDGEGARKVENSFTFAGEPSSEQSSSIQTLVGMIPNSTGLESDEKSKNETTIATEGEYGEGIDWDLSIRSEQTEGHVRVMRTSANSIETPSMSDNALSEAEGEQGEYLQLCLPQASSTSLPPSCLEDSEVSVSLQSSERTDGSGKSTSRPGQQVFRRVSQTMRKAVLAKGGWETHSTHNSS